MNTSPLAALALLLLAGCAVTPPSGVLSPTPTPTVTITTTSTQESTDEPTDEESAQPTSSPTGWTSEDVADRSAGQHSREADVTRWRLVDQLLGEPAKASFNAIIRSATYSQDARTNATVTLALDRVKGNPKFTDGGNEPIWLNPEVKWETITSGDLLVLVMPGDGPHQMPVADLPTYLKAEAAMTKKNGADWWTPFTVYTVAGKPVALVEWYLP